MAEGRDIGTVVAPDAPVKVFLTADGAARASRRAAEASWSTRADQDRRDRLDAAQSEKAADAVEIDSTGLDLDEVVDIIVGWLPAEEQVMMPNETAPVPVVAGVGRPNVGKSTLVNRILGSRQAVVEDAPGVTGDRVAYDALWNGRSFTVVDTGGWEPAVEGGESLAARVAAQARVAVDAADAVLFVVDATVGVTDADAAVASVLRRSGKPVVVAANKVDDTQAESRSRRCGRSASVSPPRSARCTARQRRPARPGPRRAAGRPDPDRRRGRAAPGGPARPAQRRQVQPAEQAGRSRGGAGRPRWLGRRGAASMSSLKLAGRPGGLVETAGIRRFR